MWQSLSTWWHQLTTSPSGTDLLRVPTGHVQVGKRRVRVPGFELDAHPVTNGQYADYIRQTGARTPNWIFRTGFDDPDQPVVGVTLEEAAHFARWTGKRLPTEREWVRAARGDDSRLYPWGDVPPDAARAHYGQIGKRGAPAPIDDASARPLNRAPFGHTDLAGNVWEWTRGPAGAVICGGFWGGTTLKIDDRFQEMPTQISAGIGFRCARS
jgi:formylglycine-generating enzyme required for sulfatase activity